MMGFVQGSRQPATVETAQGWAVWAVRLLVAVLVLQVCALTLLGSAPGVLRAGPGGGEASVEVVSAPGTGRPRVARMVDVKSYTGFYVDGKQINYRPEDITDGVEYAVNYLAANPRSEIRIVRTTTVTRQGR